MLEKNRQSADDSLGQKKEHLNLSPKFQINDPNYHFAVLSFFFIFFSSYEKTGM